MDKLLRSEGVKFCRFVDDYRIFCITREEAYEHLILISEKLFNEGLSLQKNKTRILTAKEFTDEVNLLLKSHQAAEENLSDEEKLMRLSIHFDPYSDTRVAMLNVRRATVYEFTVDALARRAARKSAPEVFHQIADFVSNFETLHPTA